MRLKHVLFSGLLLSVGFAACTNDEITEVNAPVTTGDAISLGEGYTITGKKYVADPTTRSIYEVADGALTPYWETTDVIGAAWYQKIAQGGIVNGEVQKDDDYFGKATEGQNFGWNLNFNYLEQVGDKYHARFQANTNTSAGAYVVYFPFDKSITGAFDAITVKREFPTTYDCTEGNEFKYINERMFSFGEAAFLGGPQTDFFELRPVPVIYRFWFGAENMQIVSNGSQTIEKVIMEAYAETETKEDGELVGKEGTSVLATEGKVIPYNENKTDLTADDYNSYIAYANGDEDGKPLPEAKYTSDEATTVGHYTIDVLGGENPDYQISGLNKASEGAIIFSALPFTKEAKMVVIKVVTSDGYVLSKTFTSAEDLAEFNEAKEEGALIQKEIFVDTQTKDNTIYTTDQFNTQWEAAIASNQPAELTIADPVILEDVTLACDNVDANVTIKSEDGAALTIGGINLSKGTLNIQADVTTDGDIVATGNSDLTISGKVTAKNISIDGAADLTVAEMESLTVGMNAEVVLTLPAEKEKTGSITIERGGKLTLESGALDGITNKGGVLTLTGKVTNYGEFKGSVITSGNDAVFVNEKGATATFTEATGNNQQPGVKFENKKGATINIEMPAVYSENNDNQNRFGVAAGSVNEGTINIVKGQLSENAAGNLTQEGADARIFVKEKAAIYMASLTEGTAKTNGNSGWIVLEDETAQWLNSTITLTYNHPVAYSVKETGDLDNLATVDAKNVFIDGAVNPEIATTISQRVYINTNQTWNVNVTFGSHLYINKDVKISTTAEDGIELTMSNASKSSEVYVNGNLTLGKGVTLKYYVISDKSMMNIDCEEGAGIEKQS